MPKLSCSLGKNLFLKSQWNLTKPFIVKKGYVPIIRKYAAGSYKASGIIYSTPDFTCLNQKIVEDNNKSILFNLSQIYFLNSNKIYTNVFINFVYNNPNQTLLSNYNLTYAYTSMGQFSVNVYTLFGGNILSQTNKYINVQSIKTYPFRKIQMNQFVINCTFNSFNLECNLSIVISNYANSYEQITIDYGDGSYDLFTINPYC